MIFCRNITNNHNYYSIVLLYSKYYHYINEYSKYNSILNKIWIYYYINYLNKL